MHHGCDGAHDQLQSVWELVTSDFPLVQFELMQDGLETFLADALLHHLQKRGFEQRFQILVLVGFAAFDAADKGHLTVGIFQPAHGRRCMPQICGFQGPHQRRGTVFKQNGGQQLPLQVLLKIKAVAQKPPHHDVGLVVGTLTLVHGVALLHTNGRKHALLVADRQINIQSVKTFQCQLFKLFMMLMGRDIAVRGKYRIAGVVMMAIELKQVVVTEVNDVVRLTTTVVVIGRGREQMAAQVLPQLGGRRTHRAFHLVVDNAPIDQIGRGILGFVEFQAVTLLGKIQWVKLGEKHAIEVDRQQIVEVFPVHAGERIGSPVAAGKGIHEGVQRPPDHHEEWVANRKTLTAAKRGMLENVSNAGGIHREGSKRHEKNVLVVICGQVQVPGAGFPVTILLNLKVERVDPVTAKLLKGRMGCVVDHCSHSNYPVFKQLENCRVTRSIAYHASLQ